LHSIACFGGVDFLGGLHHQKVIGAVNLLYQNLSYASEKIRTVSNV